MPSTPTTGITTTPQEHQHKLHLFKVDTIYEVNANFEVSTNFKIGTSFEVGTRGVGKNKIWALKGPIEKKCHKKWKKSTIFLTPPPLPLDDLAFFF